MEEMYTHELASNVKPLTQKERAWLLRLEKVLQACPSERLEFVTIGDSDLTVIDGIVVHDEDTEIHDGGASRNGVALAIIDGKSKIHGVSG